MQLGGWDILTPSAQRKPSRGVCHDLCLPLALSLHAGSCIQTCIKLPLCAQLQALPETLGRVFNKNKTEGIRNYFRGRAAPTHHCCTSAPSWVHHPLHMSGSETSSELWAEQSLVNQVSLDLVLSNLAVR